MPRVVLLGTGTHVGKTYVTRALAQALALECPEATVVAVKPVESGYSPNSPSDARSLEQVSRGAAPPEPHPLFAFRDPVSPHLAARQEGVDPANLGKIQTWLQRWQLHNACDATSRNVWLLIESAGATFSPLAAGVTNVDLALALEPSLWVLVAPDALGVLHDATVTLSALAHYARAPDALVLSASREADASTGTNAAELRRLGIADPVATLGFGEFDLGALARALIERANGSTRS